MAFLVLSAIFRKIKHCYQSLYSFLVNMGTPTQEVDLHIFLWGMTEMQWLQYTQSLNLYKKRSWKNTKVFYTCEQLESFFSLDPQRYIKSSHFCMESPLTGRVWTISQNVSISKILLWREGSIWYFVADHEYLCRLLKTMDHFTVQSARWRTLWMAARLELTLFWYRPHCFCCSGANWAHLHNKSSEDCIKTTSTPGLLPSKGQTTDQTTVK